MFIKRASEYFLNVVLIKGFCLLLIGFLAATIPLQKASSAVLLVPFGGKIVSTFICTCPALSGMSVTVAGLKGGQFFWSFNSTKPYAYYFPKITSSIKGTAYPAYVPCLQVAPVGCVPGGPGGLLMQKFGTSAK